MQTGMAFGKFVLLHSGHVRFLEKARSLVDRLVVVVASDATVERERGKCLVPAGQRREVVAALKSVDEAVVGGEEDKYSIVAEKKPDVIVLGPDQEEDEERLAYELRKRGLKPKIVRVGELTGGELNKTSKIIERITSSKA